MSNFGLIGPSYPAPSLSADAQMTMNLYLEKDEGNGGKARWSLYNTPGLAKWLAIGPNYAAVGKGRGIFTTQGRTFAVVGQDLWEIFGVGVNPIKRSNVNLTNDNQPVSFACNATQLAVASGGSLYAMVLGTNVFSNPNPGASFVKIGYNKGFGIGLVAQSNVFYVSAASDFTAWNNGSSSITEFPDFVLDMVIDHDEIWFLGQTKAVPYYNDGGALFAYDVVPGGYVDQGTGSIWGSAQLDNTFFWVGNDSRGTGIVWKMAGYLPQRVSTHAVENDIRQYQTRSDAVAYGYTENGHSFYRIVFPSAGTCWTYDVATGMWHQRAYRNPATGNFQAPIGLYHTYNDSFNAHLVLDSADGTIYQSSIDFQDDAGVPIRHVRRSAYVSKFGRYVHGKRLELAAEMGLGPIPPLTDGQGNPRGPQVMVRWSDDGAHTWSNERTLDLGQAGQYGKRAYIDRLGMWWGTQGRVFELSYTDPRIKGLIEADLVAA